MYFLSHLRIFWVTSCTFFGVIFVPQKLRPRNFFDKYQVYLCVFCNTASGWTLRRRSAQTIRTACLPAGWRSRTLQNPTLQTQRGADVGTADLRESGGVGGRELALGSDGLPAGWWWLRGSWAGWEAARQERAGTTRPATRR